MTDETPKPASGAARRRPQRTPQKVARALVVNLIEWEIGAAAGEGYYAACDEFGEDQMRRAMRAIANDLSRKGTARPVQ